MRIQLLARLTLLGLLLGPVADSGHAAQGREVQAREAKGREALAERLIARVNHHRETHGLGPLRSDARLAAAAQAHSETMLKMRCFAHSCEGEGDLGSRLERAGYRYRMAAENIAAGFDDPEVVVDRWMRSDSHRENMLLPGLTAAGVGYAWVPRKADPLEYGSYWTLDLGRPLSGITRPLVPLPTRRPASLAEGATRDSGSSDGAGTPGLHPVPSAPAAALGRHKPARQGDR